MRELKHIFNVFMFILSVSVSYAQTEVELKESAAKLFEKEEYVEATSQYLRLLSLNPKSADYNFRYGTCLLFNSFQKVEAIRYLSFAVSEQDIDPRAFYFYGRSLHLNYQFDDAIKVYTKYLALRERKDKRYDVEREIEMCENGKRLLVTFTDIIVSEKQEIDESKFFRLYKNMETIGGDILVSAEFQSKIDKKNGHVPIVHFPPRAKAIYYSSYGDSEDNGLDIYVRRRLPDGTWGDPQILPGQVNSKDDEDFPYMHPSGDFLYFSSKGHNSMGGYDVFFSRYNPDINAFGKPENVDFAISSPDDDFFYVVDSTFKSAYFASARQSQNGKLHVYNVRVARVPIQEIIVMGDFLSEINPNNETMRVRITSNSNGAEVGKIVSNEKGKYSFVFPKGGKYNYEITVDGNEGNTYKYLVELPFLDEFRPLKQKAIHKMVDGQEMVTIVNLFDEKVEGAEALIAQVIREKASLEVNIDNFDLKELERSEERNNILAEIGFKNMSIQEVGERLNDLAKGEEKRSEMIERIESNLDLTVIAKADELQKLNSELKEVLTKVEQTTDPIEKHPLLMEAKRIEAAIGQINSEMEGLTTMKNEVIHIVGAPTTSGVGKMEVLENQYNSLVSAGKEDDAIALLIKNKDVIQKATNQSVEKYVAGLVEQSVRLNETIKSLKQEQIEFEKNQRALEAQINLLKTQLLDAKKKDADQIRSQIKDKESELVLVKEVLSDKRERIIEKNTELDILNNSLETLQNAMNNTDLAAYSKADVEVAMKQAKTIKEEVVSEGIASQLNEIERSNLELNPDYQTDNNSTISVVEIKKEYTDKVAEISGDETLSAIEKLELTQKANNTSTSNTTRQINAIERELEVTPDNQELIDEKTELTAFKTQLEQEHTAMVEELATLNASVPEIKNNVAAIKSAMETELTAITSATSTSPKEKIELQQALIETSINVVNSSLAAVQKALQANPTDAALVKEQDALKAFKMELEANGLALSNELLVLNATSSENDLVAIQNKLNQEIEAIKENNSLSAGDKLKAEQEANKESLSAITQRITEIDQQLKTTPQNESLKNEKEALNEYRSEIENDNNRLVAERLALETARVEKNQLVELQRELNEKMEAIQSNNSLTEEQQWTQRQQANNESIAQVNERINEIEAQLSEDPENTKLLEEQLALIQFKSKLESENAVFAEKIAALNVALTPENTTSLTKEEVLTDVQADYESKENAIKANNTLSEVEQLNRLQALDHTLIAALQKENVANEKSLTKRPEEKALLEKKEILSDLIAEKQNEVEERTQIINAKNNTSSVVDVATVKQTLLTELKGNYESEKAAIQSSSNNPFEKVEALLELEVAQLAQMESKKATIEKALKRNPADETLIAQNQAIEALIEEQNQAINSVRSSIDNVITVELIAEKITDVDQSYFSDITAIESQANATQAVDLKAREAALQEKLTEAIAEKDKALTRSYSVTVELEKAIFEKALAQSKERESNIENALPVTTEKERFITEIRAENEQVIARTLTSNPTTKIELEKADAVLADYERELTERIETVEVANEKTWLEKELETVQQKRRTYSVSLGELETDLVSNNSPETKRNELAQEEQAILDKLNNADVSNAERKALKGQLDKVSNEKVVLENEIALKAVENNNVANENLTTALNQLENNGSTTLEKAQQFNQEEKAAIVELTNQAEKAKTETERNYILTEAVERQEVLNNTITEVVNNEKQIELEVRENVSITSREELENQKRKFTIQIGELTTQIVEVDQQIDKAKKNEIPALQTRKNQLINQKSLLETQLRTIEERIVKEDALISVVSENALSENITFNEERKLAGTETYKEYHTLATEALETEHELSLLERELMKQQKEVRSLLEQQIANEMETEIQQAVTEIKTLQEQIDRLKIEHVQEKYAAEQKLPSNPEEAIQMQNLVLRGVEPIEASSVAASLIAMPSNGFEIKTNSESAYSSKNPIPIDVENPTGLYYRVQIGAFARPIPQDLFKEFTPVSGEKIEGSNIVRYMAGFFNNSNTVVDARTKIRALGYSDAFIVAYCDGKRIGFGEARRLEEQGLCVPKGENELVMEVVANTAEKLGLPTTKEVQEVPELSYNQAPGAVKADPIELKKGLFFTTQVGVYNRPIAAESVFGMDELITLRLPNGQIHYSSGTFNSIDEARPRRTEALNKGIVGAFITAYFKGERISLTEARRLLDENGTAILQSEVEKIEQLETVLVPKNTLRTDSVDVAKSVDVTLSTKRQVQLVSVKEYDLFPAEVLGRYNAEGSFYYDSNDKHIKSVVYSTEEQLPRLLNYQKEMNTVFVQKDEAKAVNEQVITVKVNSTILPGDFMNWLMKQPFQREFTQFDDRIEINLIGIEPTEIGKVQEDIRTFVLEMEIRSVSDVEFERLK